MNIYCGYKQIVFVYFFFRHHVYKKVEGGKDIELEEVGPRFEMKSKWISNISMEDLQGFKVKFVH